jgi:hypothetical protein
MGARGGCESFACCGRGRLASRPAPAGRMNSRQRRPEVRLRGLAFNGRADARPGALQTLAAHPFVILSPRRAASARTPWLAGRRIQPRTLLRLVAAAVTVAWASAAVGPSPGRADTRATLSRKRERVYTPGWGVLRQQNGARKPVILSPRRAAFPRTPRLAGRRIYPRTPLRPGAAAVTMPRLLHPVWGSSRTRRSRSQPGPVVACERPAGTRSNSPPLPLAGRLRESGPGGEGGRGMRRSRSKRSMIRRGTAEAHGSMPLSRPR